MPTDHVLQTAVSTGDNRQKFGDLTLAVPDVGASRTYGVLAKLEETFAFDDFTDGGGAVGTMVFTGALPAGAVVLASKVVVGAGFAGDASAALTIGDGTDVDRYNTSTIDIFTTAAAGVQSGVPSGSKLLTAANSPTLTVTTAADFTSVSAGSVTVAIYYLQA